MIAKLLLRLNLAVVNLDHIARALASDIVRTHDVDYLDPNGTQRELRRKYIVLAIESGLPGAAANQVAARAWQIMNEAHEKPIPAGKDFSFYW